MSLPLPRIYGPTSPGASVTSLLYLYDSTGVMVDPYTNVARSTGIFRAIEPFDLGTSIGTVNVSGIDTLILDTDQLEGYGQSGVQFLASISGSAISLNAQGALNTGYLASISGSVASINTQGGLNTGYLAAISGQTAHAYSSVSNSTISGSMSTMTTGIGLAANANRKRLYAQVIGSGGPLWLGYGSTAPSATSFNVLLAAATSDPGTNGGVLSDADYKGQVMCSGYIGARWMLWEGV